MKYFFTVLILLATGHVSSAQTTEDSVKATINNLFKGMIESDSALLKSAFTENPVMQGFGRNKEGKTLIETESIEEFASFIGKEPKGAAEERIKYDVIRIDGPLAMVWASYEFYYKGKFSHCGVDAFMLVRLNHEWKIQYLIDTRRRSGCK
ncbi:MAG: nuclear transport factor 2 family protein [Chitinophagaceae bacterium]|nr:nuclear transport factor 2 family protein [Chitinophagaceae bacterium]